MEKVVCIQIKDHLKTHGLQEPLQSAYRELHSTETALLRVRTDILKAMDDNKAVAVILLDVSASFDTVDHALLMYRLHHTYGICDKLLSGFHHIYRTALFVFVWVTLLLAYNKSFWHSRFRCGSPFLCVIHLLPWRFHP